VIFQPGILCARSGNSARQLITRGNGNERNVTQRFRKCLQLLLIVQLEKSVGWTQNLPVLSAFTPAPLSCKLG